ncbi:MAG: prepilin-type N-terminal cleavage/methylation domain-containing protein [Polaromonas sp.]|nr:prepilin-type N-terminal cleavage/methylation domain-containing protein [Polaromonas sp.]
MLNASNRMKTNANRTLQRGFTLIELIVVLAIVGTLVVIQATRLRDQELERLADNTADNMKELGEAIKVYVASNRPALEANATTAVTVTMMQGATACGTSPCLGGTFAPVNWTGGYTTLVRRIGAAAPFQFEALACTNNTWTEGANVRTDMLGRAVNRIGGSGGLTYDATGAFGNGGTWTAPVANFPAANVAGKLCFFVSQTVGSLDLLYLRTDGTNAMNGNLRMNNNAINDASTITANGLGTFGSVNSGDINSTGQIVAAGQVSGATLNAGTNITAGGTVTATGNITSSAGLVGATLNTTGDATVGGNVNVSPNGFVQSTGRLNIQSGTDHVYLQPNANGAGSLTIVGGSGGSGNMVVNNNVDVTNTMTAGNDVRITSLTARATPPSTTSLKELAPNLVEVASHALTADGQAIPVPACAGGGQPRVFVIPQMARGQVQLGNWGADIRASGPMGGPWTVVARDSQNNTLPNFTALARTFCTY